MNIPHTPSTPKRHRRLATMALCIALSYGLGYSGSAAADSTKNNAFTDRALHGTWIWSGMLRFSAPVPIPGTLIDGAPPHDLISGGDVVGVWASTVGLAKFNGRGKVVKADEVVKIGEIVPAPGVPFDHLPPFPETYTGVYAVDPHGVVTIQLTGRNPMNPEGTVDFEYDLHCVLNRWPKEMTCVPARFKTYAADPNGYSAPITGVIEFKRRY